MTLDVERRQVLAYRMAAQGLHRDAGDPAELGVLDLGIQDTNVGSARVALAARLEPDHGDPVTDASFTLLWSCRGAPHLHRTTDLPSLAAALWPVSEKDAMARLAAERKPLQAAGIGGEEAFATTADAMRDVVTEPMSKGEVSADVTARLPEAYAYECRSCQATHVYAGLFQLVGPFTAVRLVPDRSPTTLAPLDGRPPTAPAPSGPGELIRAYLRLHGPATLQEAAGYLGTSRTAIRSAWPDDLTEVELDGRRIWIPDEDVESLRDPPPTADVVRLLPPSDPWLQARDRGLLVPDRDRQKAVWRILGNPGAVLAGGEIVAAWRARKGTKARLDVTVDPFERLAAETRTAIEAEARHVATARGAGDVRVRYDDA